MTIPEKGYLTRLLQLQGSPEVTTMSTFRTAQGKLIINSLFYEQYWGTVENQRGEGDPIFTLQPGPGKEQLIDARATFLELRDPTGYKWAVKYLENYQHWLRLIKCPWFLPHLESWLVEMKARFRVEALEKILQIAQGASPAALPAAKYLATAEWEKPAHSRGRPSREDLKGELKRAVEALSVEQEDAQRMGLTLIEGGKNG